MVYRFDRGTVGCATISQTASSTTIGRMSFIRLTQLASLLTIDSSSLPSIPEADANHFLDHLVDFKLADRADLKCSHPACRGSDESLNYIQLGNHWIQVHQKYLLKNKITVWDGYFSKTHLTKNASQASS